MATRQQLEQYRADPNVQRMLTLISRTEGTFGAKDPYAVYGGSRDKQLSSFATHPGRAAAWQFKWNNGRADTSTASGRYQIVQGTWDSLAKRYNLNDFSPENQDLAAIALMAEKGAIGDIQAGNWQAAMKKLGKTWASLPSSPHAQAKRSQAEFDKMLEQTLNGAVAPTQPQVNPNLPAVAPTGKLNMDMPKLADTVSVATVAPTQVLGIGNLDALAPNLSKDELAAIIPKATVAPRVTDTFFTPQKVDWKSYYG